MNVLSDWMLIYWYLQRGQRSSSSSDGRTSEAESESASDRDRRTPRTGARGKSRGIVRRRRTPRNASSGSDGGSDDVSRSRSRSRGTRAVRTPRRTRKMTSRSTSTRSNRSSEEQFEGIYARIKGKKQPRMSRTSQRALQNSDSQKEHKDSVQENLEKESEQREEDDSSVSTATSRRSSRRRRRRATPRCHDENEDEVKGNEADMDLEDMPSFDPNNTLKIKTALESAVQKNGKVHETVLEEGQVTTVLEQEENENDNNNVDNPRTNASDNDTTRTEYGSMNEEEFSKNVAASLQPTESTQPTEPTEPSEPIKVTESTESISKQKVDENTNRKTEQNEKNSTESTDNDHNVVAVDGEKVAVNGSTFADQEKRYENVSKTLALMTENSPTLNRYRRKKEKEQSSSKGEVSMDKMPSPSCSMEPIVESNGPQSPHNEDDAESQTEPQDAIAVNDPNDDPSPETTTSNIETGSNGKDEKDENKENGDVEGDENMVDSESISKSKDVDGDEDMDKSEKQSEQFEFTDSKESTERKSGKYEYRVDPEMAPVPPLQPLDGDESNEKQDMSADSGNVDVDDGEDVDIEANESTDAPQAAQPALGNDQSVDTANSADSVQPAANVDAMEVDHAAVEDMDSVNREQKDSTELADSNENINDSAPIQNVENEHPNDSIPEASAVSVENESENVPTEMTDEAVDMEKVEKEEQGSMHVDDDDDVQSTAINPVNDADDIDVQKDEPSKEESEITQINGQIASENSEKVQSEDEDEDIDLKASNEPATSGTSQLEESAEANATCTADAQEPHDNNQQDDSSTNIVNIPNENTIDPTTTPTESTNSRQDDPVMNDADNVIANDGENEMELEMEVEQIHNVQQDQVQDTEQKVEPEIAAIEVPPIEPVSFDEVNNDGISDLNHSVAQESDVPSVHVDEEVVSEIADPPMEPINEMDLVPLPCDDDNDALTTCPKPKQIEIENQNEDDIDEDIDIQKVSNSENAVARESELNEIEQPENVAVDPDEPLPLHNGDIQTHPTHERGESENIEITEQEKSVEADIEPLEVDLEMTENEKVDEDIDLQNNVKEPQTMDLDGTSSHILKDSAVACTDDDENKAAEPDGTADECMKKVIVEEHIENASKVDEIEEGVDLDDLDEETENEMDGAAVDGLVITDSQEF